MRISGFNTVLTVPLMSHLATQLRYSAGGFRLCNWLSLRRLVSWINHLPPAYWSTFWKSNFKQQLGCRFAIMNLYFFVFWHMQLYVLIHQIILGLTFLNFFKYSCTNIFHRVVFMLSITHLKYTEWKTWGNTIVLLKRIISSLLINVYV